jgi:hypothetical protein
MTNTSINNGQRKQLSTQLDRLDAILDGLSEALTESVADAVKEVIGQVVSEAVSLAVKEVLSSPELLRAALHKHEPAAPTPKRRTLKDLLKSAGSYVGGKANQAATGVKKGLLAGWTWCIDKVRRAGKTTVGACASLPGTVVKIARTMWTFRKTSAIALGVGILAGVASYYAGPVIASIASGISSAALTVSGMVLLPLWRLINGKL